MKILRALLALALLLTPMRVLAQEAKALTADCVITSGKVEDRGRARRRLYDGVAQRTGQKAVSGT